MQHPRYRRDHLSYDPDPKYDQYTQDKLAIQQRREAKVQAAAQASKREILEGRK